MTTAELLLALAQECPNGVSFEPMAVRLLRQKVPFDDGQIEDLKATMIQLGNGRWYSREMILGEESRRALERQAMAWLEAHGCFGVGRLFDVFCDILRHINTPEDCSILLRHLGFTVTDWGKGGDFCFLPLPNLDDRLAAIATAIARWLEEEGGTLTLHEIVQEMPHLTSEALGAIRQHFLPEVHETEVSGVSCWRSTASITLPEDFPAIVTNVVDTLIKLEEKVTAVTLEFALNLLYKTRIREEYALLDNDTFMRVCAKSYHGESKVFANARKPRATANDFMPSRRVRGPNTRFSSLGVQIGEKLVFTKDNCINCTVVDDSNQVEFGGKAWAISALAIHLLGGSVVNGFAYFRYKNETLLERRARLERANKSTIR